MSCWLLGHRGTERPMAGGGWERTGGFSTCLSEVACPAEVWGYVARYEDPLSLAGLGFGPCPEHPKEPFDEWRPASKSDW